MHYTMSKDKQTYHLVSHFNKYWGGSLSWPVVATDNASIFQECAASPAKDSLNTLQAVSWNGLWENNSYRLGRRTGQSCAEESDQT